jgi:hypothetical protein
MLRNFALQAAAALASAVVITASLLGGVEATAMRAWAGEDTPLSAQPQALEVRTNAVVGEERAASA